MDSLLESDIFDYKTDDKFDEYTDDGTYDNRGRYRAMLLRLKPGVEIS